MDAEHKPQPTIEELEALLARGDDLDIEIKPDGSIHAVPKGTAQNAKPIIHDLKTVDSSY